MAKVLVFTVIEKLGYKSDVTKNGKLAPWVKDSIKDEYGIKKRGINHESIYASEAPNGDELYIEVVAESDDWEEFWKVVKSIRETRPRRRDDLDKWVETSGFTLLETEASIGMYDEYLLEVKLDEYKELDVVEIIEDKPIEGLKKGQRGTIVYVFSDNHFEVEIIDENGKAVFLGTLSRSVIKPV